MKRLAGKKRQNNEVVDNASVPKQRRTKVENEGKLATSTAGNKSRGSSATEESTPTEVSDSTPSFDYLPDDIVIVIISVLPARYWPSLERVDRRLQRCVRASWRNLRNGMLGQFVDEDALATKSTFERRDLLSSLLRILASRCPNIELLGGFSILAKSLTLRLVRQLIQFRNLKSVDFSHCRIQVRHLAEFLSMSGSRGLLEELHLDGSLLLPYSLGFDDAIRTRRRNDELLTPAVMEIPDRPTLKLKKFIYQGNDCLAGAFFDHLDVSGLEVLSLIDANVQPNHLANLLKRCTHLLSLTFSLQVRRIRNNFSLPLRALVGTLGSLSSEKLRVLNLDGAWTNLASQNSDFTKVLVQLGHRCRCVRALVLAGTYSYSGCVSNAVIDAIADNFVNLTRLHLNVNGCGSSALVRLVTLLNLEILGFHSNVALQAWSLDASVVKAVATHQNRLTELLLEGPVVSAAEFQVLAALTKLKKLCVSGSHITNKTVIGWCQSFGQRLESLELLHTLEISDASIAVSAKKLANVRRLSLTGSGITDISLRAIASSCPLLEELNVSRCSRMTKSGVQAVINSCKRLAQLELAGSPVRPRNVVCIDQRIRIIGTDRK